MTSTTTAAPGLAPDHALTPIEREQAHLYIEQSVSGLKGAIKGLSGAQWTFAPGPERWSIAQITEHVIFVFERVAGPMREKLAEAPPPPADRDYKLIDQIVLGRFPNRLARFPAPPFSHPSGRFASASEAVTLLAKIRESLLEYLDSTPDLRAHALEAPPLKAVTNGAHDLMDGYQWLLAAAAHAERHTKQILEVRAQDNFPDN